MNKKWYTLEYVQGSLKCCRWLYATAAEVNRECAFITGACILTPKTDEEGFRYLFDRQPFYIETLVDEDIKRFYMENKDVMLEKVLGRKMPCP